eukprot:Skav203840  [mRNA]  locus=scaffold5703:10855:11340:+ [translate_table: standard]
MALQTPADGPLDAAQAEAEALKVERWPKPEVPPRGGPSSIVEPLARPAASPAVPAKSKAKAKSYASVKRTFERPILPGAKPRFVQLFVVMLTIIGVQLIGSGAGRSCEGELP